MLIYRTNSGGCGGLLRLQFSGLGISVQPQLKVASGEIIDEFGGIETVRGFVLGVK